MGVPLNTEHLARCLRTLEWSLTRLDGVPVDGVEYEVFRNAVVKGFELSLETAGKLLRRAIKSYTGSPRMVDELNYKDVLRHAAQHGLLDPPAVERWFAYRDNRNSTAHDYGVGFAEETLKLMPGFVADVRNLETRLRERFGHGEA